MRKKISNFVIVLVLACLISLLTGYVQNKLSINSNFSAIAEVPLKDSTINEMNLRKLESIPQFKDKTLQRKSWKLVFSDNFNNDTLNLRKWNTCYWWSVDNGCTNAPNNEGQWYQPDDVLLENGFLRLRSQVRKVREKYNYTSGMITSEGKFSFQYGYLEARVRVPRGKGLWPAFWTLPANRSLWPPEIDVLEILGHQPDTVYMSNHYQENGVPIHVTQSYKGSDFSADFHKFGVLWESDRIVWVVDGIERFRVTNNIPALPMYILLNLAVGGKWPGYPDKTTVFPNYYDIDYVRVWQHAG